MLEENSLSTSIDKPVTSASIQAEERYLVKENIPIKKPDFKRSAIVKRSFYIQLSPSVDGYVATSDIANIYEMEPTKGAAIHSYLYSLIDEVIWLREHKNELSPSVLDELSQIEMYLSI